MDFFKQMAEQLKELEEKQRLAQLGHSTAGSQGNSPKNQQQAREQRVQRKTQTSRQRSEQNIKRTPLPGSQTDNECVQSGRDRRASTLSMGGVQDSGGPSLLEDLGNRLGEAVLMQEILGPPRSLKAWE